MGCRNDSCKSVMDVLIRAPGLFGLIGRMKGPKINFFLNENFLKDPFVMLLKGRRLGNYSVRLSDP